MRAEPHDDRPEADDEHADLDAESGTSPTPAPKGGSGALHWLVRIVADYFRLDAADPEASDPGAALVVSSSSTRMPGP